MDKKVEQIILGSLCGDGGVYKYPNYKNCLFREKHSIKQCDYLLWKAKQLQNEFKIWNHYSNYFHNFKNKKYNGFYQAIVIRTNFDKRLNKYRELVYPSGKGNKVISLKLLNKLTWLGIAVWYIDDGSYNYFYPNGSVAISCNKLYLDTIIKFFKTKDFNFKKCKRYVYLNIKESKKFIQRIKYYVLEMPKDIQYKLGLDKFK